MKWGEMSQAPGCGVGCEGVQCPGRSGLCLYREILQLTCGSKGTCCPREGEGCGEGVQCLMGEVCVCVCVCVPLPRQGCAWGVQKCESQSFG